MVRKVEKGGRVRKKGFDQEEGDGGGKRRRGKVEGEGEEKRKGGE